MHAASVYSGVCLEKDVYFCPICMYLCVYLCAYAYMALHMYAVKKRFLQETLTSGGTCYSEVGNIYKNTHIKSTQA
jgi:hypothetical protein